MSYDMRNQVHMLVNEAKYSLIKARIKRQTADFLEDQHIAHGENRPYILVERLETTAREERELAKKHLREAEKMNGRLFVAGDNPLPLSYWLNGKAFKGWDEHRRWYAQSLLFKGIDPE